MSEISKEVIRRWNAVNKTRFFCMSNMATGKKSGLADAIDGLADKYGDSEIAKYFEAMSAKGNTNIWDYVSEASYENNNNGKKEEAVAVNSNVKEEKPVVAVEQQQPQSNILSALSSELVKILGKDLAVSVFNQAKDELDKYLVDKTAIKIVDYNGEKRMVKGIVHSSFESIVKFVSMDEPVMLVGPAGTGKNVIAKQVAEALGLNFYFSNAVTDEYKITGFVDANGKYVETQFYKAWTDENGGLFLLDEIDASDPSAMIVLNAALANGYFDFPGIGRVERNPKFRVIANANTYGTGASMEYVGRNQLDSATLDRFAIVEVGYDSRIEKVSCTYIDKEGKEVVDNDILDFCRDVRRVSEENQNHLIVS